MVRNRGLIIAVAAALLLLSLVTLVVSCSAVPFGEDRPVGGNRPLGELDADEVIRIDVELRPAVESMRAAATTDVETIRSIVDVLRAVETYEEVDISSSAGFAAAFKLTMKSGDTISATAYGNVFIFDGKPRRADSGFCNTLSNMGRKLVSDHAKRTGVLPVTAIPPLPEHPMELPTDLDVDAIKRLAENEAARKAKGWE